MPKLRATSHRQGSIPMGLEPKAGSWQLVLRYSATPLLVAYYGSMNRFLRLSTAFVWIWHTRDSVTLSTVPISARVRPSK